MNEPEIVVMCYPPDAWCETVRRGLNAHNLAATGLTEYYSMAFFIVGNFGQILGGLDGAIWGGWLRIRNLWVSARLRSRGYGTALLARAHSYARVKGCAGALLNTGSYEARPFYENCGYAVYAELKNHPLAPHTRYFMSCRLEADHRTAIQADSISILVDPYPSPEKLKTISDGIGSHAQAALGLPEIERSPHDVFLRGDDGEITGGLLGNTWGEWMYVANLWVDARLRGKGYATWLMAAAEQHATSRGCSRAFLETFSFQALPFYRKLGYHVFGEVNEYPQGHRYYHLAKELA
jgi:GNAT superfamily N-acetyltransferase